MGELNPIGIASRPRETSLVRRSTLNRSAVEDGEHCAGGISQNGEAPRIDVVDRFEHVSTQLTGPAQAAVTSVAKYTSRCDGASAGTVGGMP
jgi:hypothetical protein